MIFERIGAGIDKNCIPKDIEIQLNKRMSQTMAEIRSKTKDAVCFHCGKPVTSFCKSHNVPRFCLESIGNDGKVTGPNAILGLPGMGVSIGKESIGIGEAGTFQIICRDCDSKIFQEYENPDNYSNETPPIQKMLSEIAVKNYLKFISKRKLEIALAEEMLKQCPQQGIEYQLIRTEFEVRLKTSIIDLEAYTNEYRRAKKFVDKNSSNGFYIIYYKLLNYVAPIAVQAPIAVSIDFEGGIVNDVVNMNPLYRIANLHLCVLPLKNQTAIIMFIDEGEKRYRKFYKQFRKYNESEKLGVINYLIFLYCEDYFLAKGIQSAVDLDQIRNIANLTPMVWSTEPIMHTGAYAKEFALSKWDSIPNLLSERYKVR